MTALPKNRLLPLIAGGWSCLIDHDSVSGAAPRALSRTVLVCTDARVRVSCESLCVLAYFLRIAPSRLARGSPAVCWGSDTAKCMHIHCGEKFDNRIDAGPLLRMQ